MCLTHTLHIACGGDDRYAIGVAVTLYSALVNLGPAVDAVHLVILDGGIGPENRQRLERVLQKGAQQAGRPVHVEFLSVDTRAFQGYRSSRLSYVSAATYMRLMLPQLLPVTIEHVLYLDADLLVLGDLGQLWQLQTTTFPAQAAVDVPNPTLTPAGLADLCRDHDLDPQATNHNAGVMLLNLKQWRQESLAEHCFTYLERYGRNPGLPHGDQDAINLVLAGRWGTLAPEWNIPVGGRHLKRWQRFPNPGIWHFITAVKPWMSHKPWYPPLRRYASYLQDSGWFSPWKYLTWWCQAVSPNLHPAFVTASQDSYRHVRAQLAQAAGRVHRRK